ncbi:hypothetical protein FAF44_48775 [Nonomuraea sp. MG754425]|uniref:protein-L-isoaspartate O-methyltransferase family protein n=1 Tax=Nonomuraea sp. MG754425 TaxID=2570319 RepID=UPI001F2618C1|nr:methyltransferase domain-containing protein [Nonomuraea sp. MG754425]MCF6476185.1 hypothetical protein [Nonomuraea sp. MG754425]
MTQAGETVRRALACVDEPAYTGQPGGARIPQTSNPLIVARMLERLEVEPGHRVLEIGTGSGFSAAVLSRLVGPDGHVTSLDIDARLTGRAARLLAGDGCRNVRLMTGDGTRWVPDPVPSRVREGTGGRGHAGFDRLIAWVAPVRVPDVWMRQATPGAVIVTPVHLAPLAGTMGVVRLRRGAGPAQLTADLLMPGGFAEARPEPYDQWLVPSYGVDALTRDAAGRMWWVAAEWLRAHEPIVGMRLLERMITDGRGAAGPSAAGTVTGLLAPGERGGDLHAFLMAVRPDGLTTAALGEQGWGVGCSEPGGVTLVGPAGDVFHAGAPAATERLAGWIGAWRGRGRPGMAELVPQLRRHGTGWDVRAIVP